MRGNERIEPGHHLIPTCGWPARLTYEHKGQRVTMRSVVEVSASGLVSITTHVLASLRGHPMPDGPEGAYVVLNIEQVHNLLVDRGLTLVSSEPA